MDARPELPALHDCGFVRVPAAVRGGDPLWMSCEACAGSDHFWIDTRIHCRCGASYDHAVRPDGSTLPVSALTWVRFEDGPKQLASLEWDTTRVALLATAIIGVLGVIAWGWLH